MADDTLQGGARRAEGAALGETAAGGTGTGARRGSRSQARRGVSAKQDHEKIRTREAIENFSWHGEGSAPRRLPSPVGGAASDEGAAASWVCCHSYGAGRASRLMEEAQAG